MMDIRIINFGLDFQFANTERLIKSLLKAFRYDPQSSVHNYEIEFKKVINHNQIATNLRDVSFLGHVMSHGERDGNLNGIFGSRRANLAYGPSTINEGPILNMDGLLLDACHTLSKAWIRNVANSVPKGHSMVVIGTTSEVGWDEAATYVTSFYSALLHGELNENRRQRRSAILRAHKFSQRLVSNAYSKDCTFKVVRIQK
jgi:hypothetical protein